MNAFSRLVFEKKSLGIPGVHSLGQYNYAQAGANLPLHQHEGCIEVSLLVKGQQTYQIGKESYQFKSNDQFVCFDDQIHGTGSGPQEKGILYWLILDISQASEKFLYLEPAFAKQVIKALLGLTTHHFVADPESRSTLDKAFRALREVRKPDECSGIYEREYAEHPLPDDRWGLGTDRPEFSLSLLEAMGHLTNYILQTIQSSRASSRKISPLIQEGLRYMEKHEGDSPRIAEVAQVLHLAETSFKTRFRNEVGLPPAEYMLRRKIETAKQRLTETGANITDVAHDLGFSTSQYFATVFRRYTHQTPSDFLRLKHGSYDLVFDGDSITYNWQTAGQVAWRQHYGAFRAVNLGVGGDTMQSMIGRVQNGSLEGMDPKLIVVTIGTNERNQGPPKEVGAEIKTLLAEYKSRCPNAHILLLAVFPPDPSPASAPRQWAAKVNAIISGYADDRVTYLDINARFLQPDGTVAPEIMVMNPRHLHPTAKGYKIWADAIQPMIDQYVVGLVGA